MSGASEEAVDSRFGGSVCRGVFCRVSKMEEGRQWALFVSWILVAAGIAIAAGLAHAETPGRFARVKDVATIEGIRDNQLVGYGLVVGLRGTGDSSQTVFPAQTLISALERMGVTFLKQDRTAPATCRLKIWQLFSWWRRCRLLVVQGFEWM